MTRQMWLNFDNEKFSGEEFSNFLNVQVTNDCTGGDSEETKITFDTGNHGGSHIRIQADGFPEDYDLTSEKITLTLYGGFEASAFFSAITNLAEHFKVRVTIGD